MSIKQDILRSSFQEISQDTKFIRLSTITTFIHSLFFVLYISYWASNVITTMQGGDNKFVSMIESFIDNIGDIDISIIIIIVIFLLIGYAILPPIGEGAMIFYLDSKKKQGTLSLGKGLGSFFQMMELDGAMYVFHITTFFVAVSRMYVMGILDNIFIKGTVFIRGFLILSIAFLLPYSRVCIALEKLNFFDAIKKSAELSMKNFAITFKFVLVDFILHLRFLINIVIVFGIPLALMYFGNQIGINENSAIQSIFVIIVIILFLLTAYINGIIEAFFATYWYKVYKHIQNTEKHDEDGEREIIIPTIHQKGQQQVGQQKTSQKIGGEGYSQNQYYQQNNNNTQQKHSLPNQQYHTNPQQHNPSQHQNIPQTQGYYNEKEEWIIKKYPESV